VPRRRIHTRTQEADVIQQTKARLEERLHLEIDKAAAATNRVEILEVRIGDVHVFWCVCGSESVYETDQEHTTTSRMSRVLEQAEKAEAEAKHAEAQQQLDDLQRAVEKRVWIPPSPPPSLPPSMDPGSWILCARAGSWSVG
jgi:hypothetical protein